MNKRWAAIVAAVTLCLAACVCNGEDGGGAATPTEADGELRTVTVGMLPILPTAALHAGIEQGFFEDRGLELKIESGQGGAALLPAVVSGQMQFATSNPVSLMQAAEQGLDVQVIAHWTSAESEGEED